MGEAMIGRAEWMSEARQARIPLSRIKHTRPQTRANDIRPVILLAAGGFVALCGVSIGGVLWATSGTTPAPREAVAKLESPQPTLRVATAIVEAPASVAPPFRQTMLPPLVDFAPTNAPVWQAPGSAAPARSGTPSPVAAPAQAALVVPVTPPSPAKLVQASDCGERVETAALATLILYEPKAAQLTQTHVQALRRFVTVAAACPATRIRIGGFADDGTDLKADAALAARRATLVRRTLVTLGLPETQITAVTSASARASNGPRGTRPAHRRVQISAR
jgi:outer membrane protein OmpA-like peptidoglycan-associated protein